MSATATDDDDATYLIDRPELAPRPWSAERRPERWRDVERYEGLYRISDHGRLVSLEREVIGANQYSDGCTKLLRGRDPMHPTPYPPPAGTRRMGHYGVILFYLGDGEKFTLHRLVAQHFVPRAGPHLTHVHFRDGDWRNVHADNLQWVAGGRGVQRAHALRAPDGEVHIVVTSMAAFCREHGLSPPCMSYLVNGMQREHRGWTLA